MKNEVQNRVAKLLKHISFVALFALALSQIDQTFSAPLFADREESKNNLFKAGIWSQDSPSGQSTEDLSLEAGPPVENGEQTGEFAPVQTEAGTPPAPVENENDAETGQGDGNSEEGTPTQETAGPEEDPANENDRTDANADETDGLSGDVQEVVTPNESDTTAE